MLPDQWERLKELFAEAVELPSLEERARYADQNCQDQALREELKSLLAEHEQIGDFIDLPPPGLAPPASGEGRRVGPYLLLRKLGEGGMGAVYLASRADAQFEKQVAVKMLHPGAQSKDVIRRFLAERQILATLEHPSIARLLDGGTTPQGEPYLVMEYVAGTPIDRYCRERGLGIEERLQLFAKVCSAVEYAHANSVVHRDIKPANILVTAEGQPKLLDFGIAKILRDAPLALETGGATFTGLRLMTPEYASPEQVRGEAITAVSDVYSLGVLLYELLTDAKPYQFTNRLIQEVARVVCEEIPAAPSAKAKTLATTSVPGDERELSRRLSGDLDTIVLMALRKEPGRRYQSVRNLRDDLERHSAGLPVTARSDTLGYRSAKFIRRNGWAVAACALIFLATVAAVWQARVARSQGLAAEAARIRNEEISRSISSRVVWSGPDVDAFGAVSRDGHFLSYTDWPSGNLAVRDLATSKVRRLTNTGDRNHQAQYSIFSPESQRIAYFWVNGDRNEVRVINLDGTGERVVLSLPESTSFRLTDWYGESLLGLLETGETRQLTMLWLDGRLQMLEPARRGDMGVARFSPDGKRILHDHAGSADEVATDVYVYSLETGKESPATIHPALDYAVGWLNNESVLFGSDRTGSFGLWATAPNSGEAVQLRPSIGRVLPLGLTSGGSLLVAMNAGLTDVYTAELNEPTRPPMAIPHRYAGNNRFPLWSRDGRSLIYESQHGTEKASVVIRNETGQERQFQPSLEFFRRPQWRGDKLVAYGSDGKQTGMFEMDPASGAASLLISEASLESRFPPVWARDGRTLYTRYFPLQRGVFRMDLAAGSAPAVLWTPPPGAAPIPSNPALSLDNARIAFPVRGMPAGKSSLLVMESRGGSAVPVFTVSDPEILGAGVAWLPDSRTLVFSRGFDDRSEVWTVGADGSGAKRVMSTPLIGLKHLSVHPNGQRYAFQAGEPMPEILAIDNLISQARRTP